VKREKELSAAKVVELIGQLREETALTNYLAKGRKWSTSSDLELSTAYIEAFRSLAADPSPVETREAFDDLGCEFPLRDQEPPYDQLKSEIDEVAARAAELVDLLDESEKDRIDKEMFDDAKSMLKRRN
jgi:hypothetical protein